MPELTLANLIGNVANLPKSGQDKASAGVKERGGRFSDEDSGNKTTLGEKSGEKTKEPTPVEHGQAKKKQPSVKTTPAEPTEKKKGGEKNQPGFQRIVDGLLVEPSLAAKKGEPVDAQPQTPVVAKAEKANPNKTLRPPAGNPVKKTQENVLPNPSKPSPTETTEKPASEKGHPAQQTKAPQPGPSSELPSENAKPKQSSPTHSNSAKADSTKHNRAVRLSQSTQESTKETGSALKRPVQSKVLQSAPSKTEPAHPTPINRSNEPNNTNPESQEKAPFRNRGSQPVQNGSESPAKPVNKVESPTPVPEKPTVSHEQTISQVKESVHQKALQKDREHYKQGIKQDETTIISEGKENKDIRKVLGELGRKFIERQTGAEKPVKPARTDSPSESPSTAARPSTRRQDHASVEPGESKAATHVKTQNVSPMPTGEVGLDRVMSSSTDEVSAVNRAGSASSASRPADAPRPTPMTDQILSQIQLRESATGREVTVKLNPPDLGELRIQFRQNGGEMIGEIRVDNARTLIRLQQEAPALAERLNEAGLQVKNLDLLMNDTAQQGRGESNPNAQNFAQTAGQEHPTGDPNGRAAGQDGEWTSSGEPPVQETIEPWSGEDGQYIAADRLNVMV